MSQPVEYELKAPPIAPPEAQDGNDAVAYSEREAWEFVHFLSAHTASMETRAAIIIPAQVAGLIALWTQFFTFEEALPKSLAWMAWAVLMLGVIGAGWIVMPPRLGEGSLLAFGLEARRDSVREAIVREVCDTLQTRLRRLHVGLRVSVGLTMLALGLTVLAYAIDKIFFAP
jgi:hypothetical protein